MIVLLIQGIFLCLGNPNNPEVRMTPEIRRKEFLINRLAIRAAPILCPYKNKGKFGLACLKRTSISLCNSSTELLALVPPENLKENQSIKHTKALFHTQIL